MLTCKESTLTWLPVQQDWTSVCSSRLPHAEQLGTKVSACSVSVSGVGEGS